jgi:hypothetical protein
MHAQTLTGSLLTSHTGTDPLKSRKLVLDWSECLFLSVQVANALERRTEPMPDGMVPMLGKILEAVAGAVAEGGAEEKHKASLCISFLDHWDHICG